MIEKVFKLAPKISVTECIFWTLDNYDDIFEFLNNDDIGIPTKENFIKNGFSVPSQTRKYKLITIFETDYGLFTLDSYIIKLPDGSYKSCSIEELMNNFYTVSIWDIL